MSDDFTLEFQDDFGFSNSDLEVIEDRYELTDEIGAGGMGFVVKAKDKRLDREVALKSCFSSSSDLKRQMTEAKALAKVNSPFVVDVYDYLPLAEKRIAIVMRWIEGEDLSAKIRNNSSLPHVVSWMKDVCEGMMAAESVSIVHRDIKPGNIMVDGNGRACVMDFGLSRLNFNSSMTGNRIMGTPLYMSPEQAEDSHAVDSRADIYGFGATFYHALTNRPPFEGKNFVELVLKHRIEPVVSPRNYQPSIPKYLNDCIERCLAKNPRDRFQKFAEVREVLNLEDKGDPWALESDSALAAYESIYNLHRERLLGKPDKSDQSSVVFDFPNSNRLEIVFGRLEEQCCDAVVTSDDSMLSMGGGKVGVSGAIAQRAGPKLLDAAKQFRPVRAGRVVVTPGFELDAKYVFHGVTVDFYYDENGNKLGDWRDYMLPSKDVIMEIIDSCFYHAETLRVTSIAFPLLGTGVAGVPRDVCLNVMFRSIARRLLRNGPKVQNVKIVLFPPV